MVVEYAWDSQGEGFVDWTVTVGGQQTVFETPAKLGCVPEIVIGGQRWAGSSIRRSTGTARRLG